MKPTRRQMIAEPWLYPVVATLVLIGLSFDEWGAWGAIYTTLVAGMGFSAGLLIERYRS